MLVHGACEHSGRYTEMIAVLTSHNWNVVTLDMRGHGQSEGIRTHIKSGEEYLADIAQVSPSLNVNLPTILIAHSMGGMLAARVVETQKLNVSGLILLNPLFEVGQKVPGWKYGLGKICAFMAPQTRFATQLKGTHLTGDARKIEERQADLLIIRSVTASWFFAIERMMAETMADKNLIACPILIMQSTQDVVVNPLKTREFYDQLVTPDKEWIAVPDQKHELLNDTERKRTQQQILGWLDRKFPADQ